MFSSNTEEMDVEHLFQAYRDTLPESNQLDLIFENYLGLVNRLKSDLQQLKEELNHHKKVHGEITDSLDEFFTIQRLSSLITRSLEYPEILKNLDEIAQKVIPHKQSAAFILQNGEFVPIGENISRDFFVILQNMQEEGILEWLWEQAHPIVVPIEDFVLEESLENKDATLVISPMIQQGESIGIYLLLTDKDQANFSFRDLELLNILIQQATIAIQYTRLYKKLEQTHNALKQSQTRLMQTIKLATVGELAGGIAHEINNPLQIILGNIQMALMGYKVEESLKVVETQAMRIANIVRGLLSMARQKSSNISEYLEINPLILNTVNLVRSQIEKRGIKLNLELADNLPIFKGSTVYLQQILLNFLLHSKKQISRDGVITIRTSLVDEGFIQIEIRDTGIPMPPEYIEKIMDPFSNIEHTGEMNLGLTVSIQMIKDIGGTVRIQSFPEEGNAITIQIPKYQKDKANHESEAVSMG